MGHMIHMSQVKVAVEKLLQAAPVELTRRGQIGREEEILVRQAAAKVLQISPEEIKSLQIEKKSMDARKAKKMHYIYRVALSCDREEKLVKRCGRKDVQYLSDRKESVPLVIQKTLRSPRPVVTGFGPAGMFAALELARAGLAPIIVERGRDIEARQREVDAFWQGGRLNPECNVQFGEGGAGTFSDGKLNTQVKDASGRNRRVLLTLAEFGAPSEILYLQKPHIGTDRLREVVKAIREEICALGGEVWFGTKLEGLRIEKGTLQGIFLDRGGKEEQLGCRQLVLAIGHSARDTFYRLHDMGLAMEPKAFAIGVRVEHPQEMIGRNQYGAFYDRLPAADYKLTYQTESGRGVYSFCMCPGGYVVNASSEEGRLAVNGMSYYERDGINANSAIIVTVTPEDFGRQGVLAGVEFQRHYEQAAYEQAGGKIPVQLFADFQAGRTSTIFGNILPQMKGAYALGNVRKILPLAVGDAIAEGMQAFDRRLKGFAAEDVLLSGIESRTSSPVRMLRDESLQSNIRGIYPCGEGAGYAGGITSAAMDGLRVAEAVLAAG